MGGNPKNTHFPFVAKPADFEQRLLKEMNGASPDILDIMRRLKPYPGGNDALRAIHDLDLIDKHRKPLVAGEVVGIPNITINGDPIAGCSISGFKQDQIIVRCGIEMNLQVDNNTTMSFHIIFENEQPCAGRPVMPTLRHFVDLVEGIINLFRVHYQSPSGTTP